MQLNIYLLLSLSCCRIVCELQDKLEKIIGIECDMTEEQKKEYDQYAIE